MWRSRGSIVWSAAKDAGHTSIAQQFTIHSITTHLAAPWTRVETYSDLRGSCRMRLSCLLTAVHRIGAVAGSHLPRIRLPTAYRQQCSKSKLELNGSSYRQAHVQVAPKGTEGEEEVVASKGNLHEVYRRRRGRRPTRKEAVEGARLDSIVTPSHRGSQREQPMMSRLLRTSRTELEHMTQASESDQHPPAAADDQQRHSKPLVLKDNHRSRAVENPNTDTERLPPRVRRQRRASPLPEISRKLRDKHSRTHLRHENALSTCRDADSSMRSQASTSPVKQRKIVPDWVQFCVDWLWVPSWPAVPKGQLSNATPTKQLQAAQVENNWHVDDENCYKQPHLGGTQCAALARSPLGQLHAVAKAGLPAGTHPLAPELTNFLLDRCLTQTQTQELPDGVALQVVRDAAVLMAMLRRVRTSDWQERMLAKVQALMANAACKSIAEDRISSVASEASGSQGVPSKALFHGLAVSFTLAEAGVTSAEYVEAVSKLLYREMNQIASTASAPVSLATVTCIMQALANAGSSSSDAQHARAMAAAAGEAAIFAGLCNIKQRHRSEIPVLTVWDWARFYVPTMGLLRGAYAALHYPSPLLHMQGLYVQHKGDRVMSQFSLPAEIDRVLPATAHRIPNSVPWRTFAAVGQRHPVDTLVLLLHSFLVTHFRQSGLSSSLASLDSKSFRQQYQSAFSASDVHFMRQVYAGLHALEDSVGNRWTVYPQKLMLADCISRTLGLLHGRWADAGDKELQTTILQQWEKQQLTRNTIRAIRRHHKGPTYDLFKLLGRISMHQPSLRQRVLCNPNIVTAGERDPMLHTAAQYLRSKLVQEVDESEGDNQTCRWLSMNLWSVGKAKMQTAVLHTAVLEDTGRFCAKLKDVPDNVVSIFSCFSNPELRGHSEILDTVVGHLPDRPCNRDVAQALHDAASQAPVDKFVQLATCIRNIMLLVNTVEAIHKLHARPAHAAEAIVKMRKVNCLRDTIINVGDRNVEQLKDRVCQTVPAAMVVSRAIFKILEGFQPITAPQQVTGGAVQQPVTSPQTWLEDIRELVMKAGSGVAMNGCRVSAEVAAQSTLSPCLTLNHQNLPEALEKNCTATLFKLQGRPSELQKRVHLVLQKLGYPVHSERRVHGLPLIVDVLTRGVDKNGYERDIVLEVDGPSHFLYSPDAPPQLCPEDELKAASLLLQGIPVIRVSYHDWDRIAVSGHGLLHGELQVSWLQKELEQKGIVGPATIPLGHSHESWSPD